MAYSMTLKQNNLEQSQDILYRLIDSWIQSIQPLDEIPGKILRKELQEVHQDDSTNEIYGFLWYGAFGNPGELIDSTTRTVKAYITLKDAPTHPYFFYFGRYVGNNMLFLLEKKSNFSFYTHIEEELYRFIEQRNYKLYMAAIQSKEILLRYLNNGFIKSLSVIKINPDITENLLGNLDIEDINVEVIFKAKRRKFFGSRVNDSLKAFINGNNEPISEILESYFDPNSDLGLKAEIKVGRRIRTVYMSPEARNLRSLFDIDPNITLYGTDNRPILDVFLGQARNLKEDLINVINRADQ